MLADAGATAVIVGHSERRADHHETDAQVRAKAQAAWRAGLTAIVCIGEQRGEREAGRALDVVGRQLDGSLPDAATAANMVVAYEPVWAIGTGLDPTPADIAEVHGFIRQRLGQRFGGEGGGIRILYGGSVNPANAKTLLARCRGKRRAGRRRQPESARFSRALRRCIAKAGKGGKALRDRVETAANSYITGMAPPGRAARPGAFERKLA